MNEIRLKALIRIVLLVISMPLCIIADIFACPYRAHGESFHTEDCWDQITSAYEALATGTNYG